MLENCDPKVHCQCGFACSKWIESRWMSKFSIWGPKNQRDRYCMQLPMSSCCRTHLQLSTFFFFAFSILAISSFLAPATARLVKEKVESQSIPCNAVNTWAMVVSMDGGMTIPPFWENTGRFQPQDVSSNSDGRGPYLPLHSEVILSGQNNVINHPFGNGLYAYHLYFMVIWGMVY